MTDPRSEQPFHDLVAAARHGAYAIHAAWSDAHPGHIALRGFCACGYGSIPGVAGVVPLCTALARIPAEFEERVMDELAPTDQTITMSATGGVYPQPVTTGRRRIVLTTPWVDAR